MNQLCLEIMTKLTYKPNFLVDLVKTFQNLSEKVILHVDSIPRPQ